MTQVTASIRVQLTNVFEGWQDDLEGIDQKGSNYRYAEVLRQRIQATYPQASVTVDMQHNVSGTLPTDVTVYGDAMDGWRTEDEIRHEIDSISEALFEDTAAWLVQA